MLATLTHGIIWHPLITIIAIALSNPRLCLRAGAGYRRWQVVHGEEKTTNQMTRSLSDDQVTFFGNLLHVIFQLTTTRSLIESTRSWLLRSSLPKRCRHRARSSGNLSALYRARVRKHCSKPKARLRQGSEKRRRQSSAGRIRDRASEAFRSTAVQRREEAEFLVAGLVCGG